MFDGRISFDGITTAKNFVVGSYGAGRPQVKGKTGRKISSVSAGERATYRIHRISTGNPKTGKTARLRLLISV
jgi:hypothetical protein